jgi:flagella basal body P-ring formation protein FlgA
MSTAAAVAFAGCLAVGIASDHITAGDLAPAFAAMATLAPETVVALAPSPGVVRVFRAPQLRSLAARFHLSETPERDICAVRPVAPLDAAALLDAMKGALPQARIELLDYSRQPVPSGTLEFPVSGLRGTRESAVWTGYVRYAGTRRFSIWSRVKIAVTVPRVMAIGDLHPGKPVAPGEVIAAERDEFPSHEPYAASVDEVVGRIPAVLIRAGTAIRTDRLSASKDVVRGDRVAVEVRNGATTLKLAAQAEASGSIGESIPVRNPASNKRFRARVEGKGQVAVDAAGGSGKTNP